MSEELLDSRRIYDGRVISLRVDRVRLPSGRETDREIVEHAGAVGIVALDHHSEVLLVRQFRSAAGRMLLEIPAGTIGEGEDPLACAYRELVEETGHSAKQMDELYAFYSSPGFSNERIWLFLATDLQRGSQTLQIDEAIEVVRLPLEEALEMVDTGEICDGKSILGLLAARSRVRGS